jgi:hypothetical protein
MQAAGRPRTKGWRSASRYSSATDAARERPGAYGRDRRQRWRAPARRTDLAPDASTAPPRLFARLNPIEQVIAKLKHLLRKAAERTKKAVWRRIGSLLDQFTPQQYEDNIRNAGYGSAYGHQRDPDSPGLRDSRRAVGCRDRGRRTRIGNAFG